MKIWPGYSSEHSSNLVMIGQFKQLEDATEAKEIIEQITRLVMAEEKEGLIKLGENTGKYPDSILKLLRELNIYSLSPSEIEQFAYDLSFELKDDRLILQTDEYDISAFLKILIDKGARVEIFSAHTYPKKEK
jgi:hypothetical protein